MKGCRRRSRRSTAVALGAALVLCFGATGSADWLLCLGDDGHKTIELAHADSKCWSEVRRHHDGRAALGVEELEHHGCRDVPLIDGRVGHGPPQRPVIAAAPACWWRIDSQWARPAAKSVDGFFAARLEQRLRCHRSVVLLV